MKSLISHIGMIVMVDFKESYFRRVNRDRFLISCYYRQSASLAADDQLFLFNPALLDVEGPHGLLLVRERDDDIKD